MKSFSSLVALAAVCFAEVALASSRKCPPLKCSKGYIGTRFANGTSPGFISKHFYANTSGGIFTTSKASALLVGAPSTDVKHKLSQHNFNFQTFNGPLPGSPWLGAVYGLPEPLAPGSAGFAWLSATPKIPAGPVTSLNAESQIWRMSCKNHQVTASWINADGSSYPITVFSYAATVGVSGPGIQIFGHRLLGITGDLEVTDPNDPHIGAIALTFVPECLP
jgi:hypothetical protein